MNIKEELKRDLKFSSIDLEEKISKLPNVATKWHDRLNHSKLRLAKLEIDRKRLTLKWYKYYTGKSQDANGKTCPFILDQREIRDFYLPANDEIVANLKDIEVAKAEVRELDNACKQMNQLHWSIKEFIDWQKFTNGV